MVGSTGGVSMFKFQFIVLFMLQLLIYFINPSSCVLGSISGAQPHEAQISLLPSLLQYRLPSNERKKVPFKIPKSFTHLPKLIFYQGGKVKWNS